MKKKLSLNRETIRNLDVSDLGRVHGGTGDTYITNCLEPPCTETPCLPTQCEDTCQCNTHPYCVNTYAPVC